MSRKPLIRRGELFSDGRQSILFTRDLFPDDTWTRLAECILVNGKPVTPQTSVPRSLVKFVGKRVRGLA